MDFAFPQCLIIALQLLMFVECYLLEICLSSVITFERDKLLICCDLMCTWLLR